MFNDSCPGSFSVCVVYSCVTLEVWLIKNLILKSDRAILQSTQLIIEIRIDRTGVDYLFSELIQFFFVFQIVNIQPNFNTFQPDDLYNNTVGTYDWSGIQAVQDKSVYKMPLGMYRSYTPGIDTPITLLWMAKTTYPTLFEDIDVTQRAIDYYETVFGVTLTSEQVETIFAPISAAGTLYF